MSQFSEQADNHNTEGLIPVNQWGENIIVDLGLVETNFLDIKNKIVPYKPRIIAVTKYFGIDAIEKAYKVGVRDFGESRATDAILKIESLPVEIRRNSTFHFIGHLQTNKVERVVNYFDYIHSVDSLKLAQKISDVACQLNKRERIFLQVNNADEKQKFGYSKPLLERDFDEITALRGIEIVGLMNMAPLNASPDELKLLFSDLRKYRDKLECDFNVKLPELSMGMSDDYEYAVREGATMIRIGRKLFK